MEIWQERWGRWEQTDSPIKRTIVGQREILGNNVCCPQGIPSTDISWDEIRRILSSILFSLRKKNQDEIRIKPGGIGVCQSSLFLLRVSGVGWGPPRREFMISDLGFCVGAASGWGGWAALRDPHSK